ncbi:MAG: hypothetical protein GEU93_10535 [Propionibacteriales bacterium]|nr:hypothetical protein [Propionibacteriales bacterium]
MDRRLVVACTAAVGLLSVVAAVGVAGGADREPEPESTPSLADRIPRTPDASPPPDEKAFARERPSRWWLLPNLRSLRARDVQIRGSGDDRRLRFAAWLANDGPGPLLLRPRPGRECPPEQRPAKQTLHVDKAEDGRFQRGDDPRGRSMPVGCMLDHPTHDHWHFDAMARYELLTVDGTQRVAGRNKVSFCLRDNTRVPGSARSQQKRYFGECERDTVQGISPGWVDVYDVDTPGQRLRLPAGMADGTYCLVLEADPLHLLLETEETDNAAASAVRIVGSNVRTLDTRACVDAAD